MTRFNQWKLTAALMVSAAVLGLRGADAAEAAPPLGDAQAIIKQLLREGKIMRADDAKKGMVGIGRSVFAGTKVETFKVEIIGTLKKVMGGGDLVLIKVLDGPVVKRQSGIIAGMSGSPVYFNGKMLGAIAIGFGFPKEPIGGVTPITQMIEGALPQREMRIARVPSGQDEMRNGKPEVFRASVPISVGGKPISQVVVSRGPRVATMPGTLVGRPATMMMQIGGFSPSALPRLREIMSPWGIEPVMGTGGGAPVNVANPPFVPGGAIGIPLVSGDLDMSAVGTITFRWGNRILAFGHPMFSKGALAIPMSGAFVHDIFPSYMQSFKLASPLGVVGTLQTDTAFAVGGTLGQKAQTIPMRVELDSAARGIRKTYNVNLIQDNLFTPLLVQMVGAELVSGTLGMETQNMVRAVTKVRFKGLPEIAREDYLWAEGDAGMPGLGDMFESVMLSQMNPFSKGEIESIAVKITLEKGRKTARIRRITADRNKAKAGETVRVNVLLEPHGTPDKFITQSFNFTVPADAPDGALRITAGTAGEYWDGVQRVGGASPRPTNLKELIEAYQATGAANELLVQASTPQTFLKIGPRRVDNPPASWAAMVAARGGAAVYNEVQTQRQVLGYSLTGASALTIPVESGRHSDRERPDTVAGTGGSTSQPSPLSASFSPEDISMDTDEFEAMDEEDFVAAQSRWMRRVESHPAFSPYMKSWWQKATRGWRAAAGDPPPSITPITPVKPPTPAEKPEKTDVVAEPPAADGSSPARPSGKWVQDSAAAFGRGTFEGTAVSSEGILRPSPAARLLAATTQPVAWSVASSGNSTYIGTGHEARVYRFDETGAATTIYEGNEVGVTALTTDAAGNIYAGLTPGGRVVRLNGAGASTPIFDSGSTFVWALEWDSAGRLLIGTGGARGAVYRLDDAAKRNDEAKPAPLVGLPQKHVRAIAVQGNDIFIGTADSGMLYKFSADGTLRVLYEGGGGQPAQPQMMSPDMSLMMQQRPPMMMMGGGMNPMMQPGGAFALMAGAEGMMQGGAPPRPGTVEITALAATADGVYFGTSNGGTVYQWTASRGVLPAASTSARTIYALRQSGGKIYAATGGAGQPGGQIAGGAPITPAQPQTNGGNRGAVHEITPATPAKVTRLFETSQPQVLALSVNDGRIRAATANNASIYAMPVQNEATGSFVSNVLDAGRTVRWGALRTLADRAQIETRSGNSVEPDATWSNWQAAVGMISAPAGRYLQYRAKLAPGGSLTRIEVVYRAANQAPSVTFTAPTGGDYFKAKKKLTWTGKDADGDTLRYRLWLSSNDGASWTEAEMKKPGEASYELPADKWQDGRYFVKVEASDALRNPEEPQTATATSRPFVIDSTVPDLITTVIEKTGDGWRIKGVAQDKLSPLVGAEWRIAPPKVEKKDATESKPENPAVKPEKAEEKPDSSWHAIAANDGIFDNLREDLLGLILSSEAKPGQQIDIRTRDAAGNSMTLTMTLQ